MLYFNYAGLSPTRPEVVRVMQEAAHTFGTLLYSESGIAWYRKQAEECSRQIASLVDLSPTETTRRIVLCPNSTLAYRIVLSLLHLDRGDVVLCSDQEHPSTWRTLQGLIARGVTVESIPARSPDEFLTRLEEAVRKPRARFLTLSQVAYSDGRVFPVQQACRIARQRDLIVAIDGAQAVGQIPVSLGGMDLDFYYFSGHKWCAGPMGTGALVITEQFQRRHSGQTLEIDLGTQNIGHIAGLGHACALRQQEWPLLSRLGELRTAFVQLLEGNSPIRLAQWNGPHAPGMASVRVMTPSWDPARIAASLAAEDGIVVRLIDSEGLPAALRASWSPATELPHITLLADKLKGAIDRLG